MDEISKKDLLRETGISYGQLYRWKREGLIPEEWFVKRSAFTGQETFFPRDKIMERICMILERKDEQSLEEIRNEIVGTEDGELDGLIREAVLTAKHADVSASVVLLETNDGKHFILLVKDGRVLADSGVKVLLTLTEREVGKRVKAVENDMDKGGN